MARPKEKRENIISSASEIFGTKGFHEANIVEIADHAGIGKGTVYEYFKSKNELFLEVVKFNAESYISRVTQEVMTVQGFHEKLNRLIDIHRTIVGENYEATGVFLNTPTALSAATENTQEVIKILCQARDQVVQLIKDILILGKKQGLILADDLDYASDIVFDMISRNNIRGFQLKLPNVSIQREQKMLIDFIIFGLSKSQ